HSTTAYRELGRLVAGGTTIPRADLQRQYAELFMRTLARPATAKRHTNVLMHMAGHLKKILDDECRKELLDCIDEYRRGLVPLVHHVVDGFLRGGAASRVNGLLDQRRQLVANSSCGICGRSTIDELAAELAPLGVAPTVAVDLIRALPDRLRATQATFDETGG